MILGEDESMLPVPGLEVMPGLDLVIPQPVPAPGARMDHVRRFLQEVIDFTLSQGEP